MHMLPGLMPFDRIARAMGAENRIRGVFQVRLRVIGKPGCQLLLVLARLITVEPEAEPPFSFGKCRQLPALIYKTRRRPSSIYRHSVFLLPRRLKDSLQPLDIG